MAAVASHFINVFAAIIWLICFGDMNGWQMCTIYCILHSGLSIPDLTRQCDISLLPGRSCPHSFCKNCSHSYKQHMSTIQDFGLSWTCHCLVFPDGYLEGVHCHVFTTQKWDSKCSCMLSSSRCRGVHKTSCVKLSFILCPSRVVANRTVWTCHRRWDEILCSSVELAPCHTYMYHKQVENVSWKMSTSY